MMKVKNLHTDAKIERGVKQLKRLSILTDVVFAVMIIRVLTLMPEPHPESLKEGEKFYTLFLPYIDNYLVILVGIVMVIIYWNQHNLQFGNLKRTDTVHATFSILQLFALLIYLYFLRLDISFEGPVIVLILESVFMALAGVFSIVSWYYAYNKKYISEKLSLDEKVEILAKLLPEPATSLLTIPFAFYGPDIWTVSWLLLIPVTYLSKILAKRKLSS